MILQHNIIATRLSCNGFPYEQEIAVYFASLAQITMHELHFRDDCCENC